MGSYVYLCNKKVVKKVVSTNSREVTPEEWKQLQNYHPFPLVGDRVDDLLNYVKQVFKKIDEYELDIDDLPDVLTDLHYVLNEGEIGIEEDAERNEEHGQYDSEIVAETEDGKVLGKTPWKIWSIDPS